MNIRHNKIKNTGILFELLVRKVAADVLDGKPDSFAVKMMREHFHSKSELGKELQLYRSFFNAPKLSEGKAFNMLDVVLQRRASLNEKLLNAQKFLLIREIKQNCDLKQFMSGRVPSYKVHASIYKLFVIVEHLKGELKEEQIVKESNYSAMLKDQPEEIRYLSYKFLLESFNEKYSNFSDKQKNLLREYINNGTNVEKFGAYVSTESVSLIRDIKKNSNKITDEVTKIKVNEVIHQLQQIQQKNQVKDNYITALLIAYQISHELNSLR
jgi:hypothetical protein